MLSENLQSKISPFTSSYGAPKVAITIAPDKIVTILTKTQIKKNFGFY